MTAGPASALLTAGQLRRLRQKKCRPEIPIEAAVPTDPNKLIAPSSPSAAALRAKADKRGEPQRAKAEQHHAGRGFGNSCLRQECRRAAAIVEEEDPATRVDCRRTPLNEIRGAADWANPREHVPGGKCRVRSRPIEQVGAAATATGKSNRAKCVVHKRSRLRGEGKISDAGDRNRGQRIVDEISTIERLAVGCVGGFRNREGGTKRCPIERPGTCARMGDNQDLRVECAAEKKHTSKRSRGESTKGVQLKATEC